MAALGWFLLQNLSQWRTADKDIRHAQTSIGAAEELYAAVITAESAVRGYLITGRADALTPVSAALTELEKNARFLLQAEKYHPAQTDHTARLAGLIKARQALFQQSILSRRTKGLKAADLQELTAKGGALSSEIRAALRTIQDLERAGLANDKAGEKAGALQRNRLLTIIFLFAFVILLGAFALVLHDGNTRRKAEVELADAHARLKSVLDSASEISIIATDLNGVITLTNSGTQKMLGYSAEELAGKTPALIHLPAEIEARSRELTALTGTPVTGFGVFTETARRCGFESREWTYVRKDQTTFPADLVVTAMKDHAGNLTGFLGLATDISARKRAELEMRKLSTAVKSSPTSIVITNREGLIEYANPKFLALTGYSEQELLGQNPRLISSGGTSKETYKELWDTLLDGREWNGELLNRKKNGELFWEHAAISPVKNSKGEILNFIAVKLDITDQKLARREIEKARDVAMQLARMKSEFLANMSHEIRTPMNAIIGMTGLLLDTPLNAQQRDYVKTVNGAGEALLDIINDILDFSKMESGKLSIEKLEFDLRETVETTADLLAPRAQDRKLELAYLIDQDVPSALRGDQGRLRQVLLNLLGNAVKFTETGEVVLKVSKAGETEGGVVLKFAVKDTGIGIPAEVQKNLFEVFTQADASTTRKYGGTGLGLSISKKLVELMGGSIGLESVHGQGSTFWFTLPFEKQGQAAAPEQARADVTGVKTLIVDDNATNREIISRYLEAWKMRFEAVASGAAALEALRRAADGGDPFRLAILDMQMPELDGLALARRIQEDPAMAAVRKVMMTSLGRALGARELFDAGIQVCLAKPVRPSALLNALGAALTATRAAPEPEHKPAPEEVKELNKYFRVLVAEDNAVNQKVAVRQLAKLGYESDVAANGLEAVEAVKRIPYDLVIMDCQMPEMDGFQATGEIRKLEQDQRHTPIIAMTANALQGDREKCLAAGMDGYIPKPVRMETLQEVMTRWDTPLDAAMIRELKELAGPENPGFLCELLGTYLRDLPARLEAIRAAAAAANAEALQQAAHALKGSSGNIGAQRLQKLCLRLEFTGKSGSLEGAGELVAALEKEIPVTRAEIEALCLKHGGQAA
ncbi:MAG: hypothetical protein A2X35_11540 [Elusimicrobia bacterium GWA2_61_42]|nr:MAG: hypothetical protein A2X35_11540 [Elusimicrobia bacterium GWA2_61_42]OGR75831.1 MAG: hypothetical protein A2X38_07375 [Elusimicrobia bacterium GWC2_61_25]